MFIQIVPWLSFLTNLVIRDSFMLSFPDLQSEQSLLYWEPDFPCIVMTSLIR